MAKIFRSFESAKKFVQSLKLKSKFEWVLYCTTEKRPDDIPSNPDQYYKDKGWVGWGDWLGANLQRRNHNKPAI